MNGRKIVAEELGSLLGAVANPYRIQIIEELKVGEKDVTRLQEILGISQSSVSQHLGVLRNHHLVDVRGEGRHKYYHLHNETIADWILQGLRFVEEDLARFKELNKAIKQAKKKWHF